MAARALSAARPLSRRRVAPAGAAVFALVWLLALAFAPEAALRGWLAAFFFAGGMPLGALVLSAMMRLIPGLWDDELEAPADAVTALVPVSTVAFLPVLIGSPLLYPWDGSTGKGAFRQAWMALPFWSVRAVLFLTLACGFSLLLRRRRSPSTLVPAGGLMLLVVLFVPVAVDWFLLLDPEAHFSGFSLSALSNFFLGALALSILLALASGAQIERPEIMGSLLLTALLAWAYFAFMQYFITWSDNLPFGVRWYGERAANGWGWVEYAFCTLRLAPLGLLLFTPVRQGRRWLAALACLALAGNALEASWLIVPAAGGVESATLPAAVAAAAAAACLLMAGFVLLPRPALDGRSRT